MAGLVAPIGEDGKLQTHSTSGDSLTAKSKKSNSTVDSDMFLSLLVAEMQNQDPLEPTSNTEWVSQYATFTQVEKMTEMADSVDILMGNSLVGKDVIMKVTSESTGDVTYKRGKVEYSMVEDGKSILVIDGNKYSLSDLDSVISEEYSEAYDKYNTLMGMIEALPDIKYADKSYENVIKGAYEYYGTMNSYQKKFMSSYGADAFAVLEAWRKELEGYGIKFDDVISGTEDDKETSLNDILESFNTKMNAILDKLNLMTAQSGTDTEDKGDAKDGSGAGTA